MKVDINKLKTFPKYGILKNLSKQRVYKLAETGRLDCTINRWCQVYYNE